MYLEKKDQIAKSVKLKEIFNKMEKLKDTYLGEMGPYVSHSILYSGGGTLDVVESIGVRSPIQDDSAKKSPHLEVGKMQVRQGRSHPLNFLSSLSRSRLDSGTKNPSRVQGNW